MAGKLVGVLLRAHDADGHYRSWSGYVMVDPDDSGRPSVAMEVDSGYVRWLRQAHYVTIHLLGSPGNRDKRPARDAGG